MTKLKPFPPVPSPLEDHAAVRFDDLIVRIAHRMRAWVWVR